MDEDLPNSEKEIFMQRCPRAMISYVVLEAVEAFVLFLLFVRFYVLPSMSQIGAMIISIFSTFVATAETEVK